MTGIGSQLSIISNMIVNALDSNMNAGMVFVDITEEFDRV